MIDDLAVCALNMDGQHLSVGEIASALKTGKEAGLSTFDEAVGLLFGLAYVVGKRCVANGPEERCWFSHTDLDGQHWCGFHRAKCASIRPEGDGQGSDSDTGAA